MFRLKDIELEIRNYSSELKILNADSDSTSSIRPPLPPCSPSSLSPVQHHRLALTFALLIGWIWLFVVKGLDGKEMPQRAH